MTTFATVASENVLELIEARFLILYILQINFFLFFAMTWFFNRNVIMIIICIFLYCLYIFEIVQVITLNDTQLSYKFYIIYIYLK